MSATIFLAFCVLGCDFLLYVLYQFTYGEKRRGFSRKSTASKHTAMNQPDARPFLVASRRRTLGSQRHFPGARQQTLKSESAGPGLHGETRAYRRIAQSFAEVKR
jgi:hypothetical protein